jgi:hypothetical protein
VFSIKALAVVTAVSAGVVFAMPVASQAMPQSAPVKVDTAKNGNIPEGGLVIAVITWATLAVIMEGFTAGTMVLATTMSRIMAMMSRIMATIITPGIIAQGSAFRSVWVTDGLDNL